VNDIASIDPSVRERLEAALGHVFNAPELLAEALTHSSFANERGGATICNERLEYLGDAVLELTVTERLFRRFPDADEGQLTRLRARLVKERTLADVARSVDLCQGLRLGKGEEAQGGRDRNALLADATEAVIGAVYLDGGLDAARQTVGKLFESRWPETVELPKAKDPKTWLQEVVQQRDKARPIYAQLGTRGPDHAKVFDVEVRLPDGRIFRASGGSLKRAEQAAASKALDALESEHHSGAEAPAPK
jgi:ribonuclease-3